MLEHSGKLVVGAAVVAVALAACTGGADGDSPAGAVGGAGSRGGTLHYYLWQSSGSADPQRTYAGVDISNLARTVYRQLVAYPISTDAEVGSAPVPDLATDTGTSSEGGRTWSFTVRDGVTWEDGRPITCQDFKYGASRAFATDVLTGGPPWLRMYLDIPTDPATGLPGYDGPYAGDGQELFDKAVTCHGDTITYHFKRPWPDFPLAIASLHMMDPYRQDKDRGARSSNMIFSDGPYRVVGNERAKRADTTFIRNENYDASSDSPDLRRALPDRIVFHVGETPEIINDRLVADHGDDEQAVTSETVPPADYSQITGEVADRSVTVPTPYVIFLVPHFRTEAMSNPAVRQALKVSTDVDAYAAAMGGERAGRPAESIVHPAVPGYRANAAFAGDNSGDVALARRILQDAGVETPVPITFSYWSSETADKASAALKETWDQAGFRVGLDPQQDITAVVGRGPDKDVDLMLSGWGADWPSTMTVIPPLFDSRSNLTEDSDGNDVGAYDSDEFNTLVDRAQTATTREGQTAALQQADAVLGRDVAYIPLQVPNFFRVHGSKVTGYVTTPSSSGYPDLGPIGVEN